VGGRLAEGRLAGLLLCLSCDLCLQSVQPRHTPPGDTTCTAICYLAPASLPCLITPSAASGADPCPFAPARQKPSLPRQQYSHLDNDGVRALVDAICGRWMKTYGFKVVPLELAFCGANALTQVRGQAGGARGVVQPGRCLSGTAWAPPPWSDSWIRRCLTGLGTCWRPVSTAQRTCAQHPVPSCCTWRPLKQPHLLTSRLPPPPCSPRPHPHPTPPCCPQDCVSSLLRLPVITDLDVSGCSRLSSMDKMRLVAKVKAGRQQLEPGKWGGRRAALITVETYPGV
jgi:hypothetical protein